MVFLSGLPVELVGWELCRFEAGLTPADMVHVRSLDTPLSHFSIDCNRNALDAIRIQSGVPNLELPDPVAMAIALEPEICTRGSSHYVEVETQSALTRGMTVVDLLDNAGDERNRVRWAQAIACGKLRVCQEIDVSRWKLLLYRSLA